MQVELVYKCKNCGGIETYIINCEDTKEIVKNHSLRLIDCTKCILKATNLAATYTMGELIKVHVIKW